MTTRNASIFGLVKNLRGSSNTNRSSQTDVARNQSRIRRIATKDTIIRQEEVETPCFGALVW